MRRNLADRSESRARALEVRLQEARADFERIVQHIIAAYHPTRVYQWGSLVDGAHFTERSDIDIAVEGVRDAESFFAMLRDASSMTRFSVDLVQMETIHPVFVESIKERGRVVYER